MTVSTLLLLTLSLLFARVLADLTDDQVVIVKQRLAQGSQQRYSPCNSSDTSSISSHATAGSSVQELRRFSNLTALDTQSPHPEQSFLQARPTRHPRSVMFSSLRGISFPNGILPRIPQSRSSKMVPLVTRRVSELLSFSQTGRINRPLTVRTMRKPSRTSSNIYIPFQEQVTVPSPIASLSSSSGKISNRSTCPTSSCLPVPGPTPSTWSPLSWPIMAS